MVEGLTPGQAVGWGQRYFQQDFTDQSALERAAETRALVLQRGLDQIFVAPTEPLARLATSSPQEGLIDYSTVAVAGFALWRVHTFNQHVRQLTAFNTAHVIEITNGELDQGRREELAEAAAWLSFMLHRHGIGWAWSNDPDGGGRGWYGTLVETLGANMNQLKAELDSHRWRWLREWPYPVFDALVAAGFVAVVISVMS
jgi:hypothetical protein